MEINKSKYFCNTECRYFPCHDSYDTEEFNCLFCYCPLYTLGTECGGNYKYTENGIKDCSDCMLPHRADSYKYIEEKFFELAELASQNYKKED